MTNKDFVNVKLNDRFHKDYKLTKTEIKSVFFYAPILYLVVGLIVRLWFINF